MKFIQPLALGLLFTISKAEDTNSSNTDSSNTDTDPNLIQQIQQSPPPLDDSDNLKIIEELKLKLKTFEDENEKLSSENKYLNEKMLKQQKRHQEILFAMSWKYEQLERKAQTYYNSFQTQKQNLGKVVNKYTEPSKNIVAENPSPLIPMYLWSEMNQKRKERQLLEKEESNNNINSESSNYESNYNNESNNNDLFNSLQDPNSDYTYNEERPVARSAGRPFSPLSGITLKSALGPRNYVNRNEYEIANNGIGDISDLFNVKKRPSEENYHNPDYSNQRLDRLRSKSSFLKKHGGPVRVKKLNPKEASEADEISGVLKGITFDGVQALHKKGGIRR